MYLLPVICYLLEITILLQNQQDRIRFTFINVNSKPYVSDDDDDINIIFYILIN